MGERGGIFCGRDRARVQQLPSVETDADMGTANEVGTDRCMLVMELGPASLERGDSGVVGTLGRAREGGSGGVSDGKAART